MNENQESIDQQNESEQPRLQGGFLERLEKEFDWNLIFVVSIWLFLFATSFLIFISA
jgi:hypothetical protein